MVSYAGNGVNDLKTKDISLCALFAALLVICGWISIPLGSISFTMQTFGVFLALFTLGGKRGSLAVLIYLLLGAVGLPVFSGFQGGVGILAGPTGGFLFGFMLTCLFYWAVTFCFGDHPPARLTAAILGLLLCYVCALLWLRQFTGAASFLWCLPFLLPDAVKIGIAWYIASRLRKIIL